MANKAEQVPTTGNKAGQSPSYKQQTHRRANEKNSTTPSKSHDESPRKKATVVVPPTSRKQEREGRNKGSGGASSQNKRGRDSEQHTNSRHGRPIHVPGEKGHSRRGHHHKQPAEPKNEQTQISKRGHRSHHGNRKQANKGEEDVEANPDSGISIEESSSPEIGGLQQEVEKLLLTETQVKEEEEDEEEQEKTKDLEVKDEQGSMKITYSREELMALKDHCLSHVAPKALLPHDVMINSPQPAKQTQETPGWVAPDQEPAVPEDSQIRHPATLSLIREHDARLMPKVSLSPQRRSFGSGCSWRDAAASASLGKQSTGSTPSGEDVTTPHTEGDSHYPVRGRPLAAVSHSASQQHSSTAPPTPTTPHTPRVIDHVPYLSRQWGGGGGGGGEERGVPRSSSWRDRHVGGSIEEEPEWMEFGPSDRSEVIELRGLEEHEARKAAKTSPSENGSHQPQEEEEQSTIHADPQSSSSPDSKPPLRSSSSSSSPHDDFIVDGFDFSTGVSICHELASDSDEEDEVTISPAKGPQQLGNALMKVLRVSSSNKQQQHRDINDSQTVRAITLEELEDRSAARVVTSVNSPKQQPSAFDKFLAAMQQNHQSEDRSSHEVLHSSMMQQQQHHPPVAPVRASPGVVSSTMMDDPRAAARVAVLNTPFQEAPLPHSKMAMRPFDRVSPMVHRQQHMGGEQHHGGLLQQQWPPSSSPWPPASTPSYNVPPVGLRQHTHQHHSLMMGSSRSGGSTQPRQASWIMEMEQQRLHQMQLREEQMREEQMRLLQHQQQQQMRHQQHMSSSPSIGLLPTSVLRQMHNAKPKQQMVNEMSRPAQYPTMGSRLEEELSNHMSHSGSYQSMMGHDSAHYTGGGVPLPYHGRTDPLLPQGYPHYRMGTSAMNPTGATY